MSTDDETPEVPGWMKGFSEAFVGGAGGGFFEGVGEAFGGFLAELEKAAEKSKPTLIAQVAMGLMVGGDLDKARAVLSELTAEQLQGVAVSAAALSSLADEVAGEVVPGGE